MAAGRQHRQSHGHRAANVKQRKAVDGRIALVEPVHLRKAPGGMDLIAVSQAHDLRASGRAAGMKERAYGVAIGRQRKVECVLLRGRAFLEACEAQPGSPLPPMTKMRCSDGTRSMTATAFCQRAASAASAGMTSTDARSAISRSAMASALSRKLIVLATPATCAPRSAG